MRPETALAVKKIIEEHFNNICAAFEVPADREAYFNQLLDHLLETFPTRDAKFYFNLCLDFWENIIEPARSLDQGERWGRSPHGELEALVNRRAGLEGEAPGAAEIPNQYPPSNAEVKNLTETKAVLEQIAALGDCLMAIAQEKDFQPRKQTFVSLGVLLHQIVEIVEDLLGKK